jgi:hypothetical protein
MVITMRDGMALGNWTENANNLPFPIQQYSLPSSLSSKLRCKWVRLQTPLYVMTIQLYHHNIQYCISTQCRFQDLLNNNLSWKLQTDNRERLLLANAPTGRISTTCNQPVQHHNLTQKHCDLFRDTFAVRNQLRSAIRQPFFCQWAF